MSNSCRGLENMPFLHCHAVVLLKDETSRSVSVKYLFEDSETWFNTIFMNKKESIRYLLWIDPMLSKFKKLTLKRNSNSVKWNLLPFEFPFWYHTYMVIVLLKVAQSEVTLHQLESNPHKNHVRISLGNPANERTNKIPILFPTFESFLSEEFF